MKLKIVQFTSLFLLLLITGVFWGTWFTLTRSLETFSAEEFIHIGKTIIANVAIPMSILMPLCILLMILSLWLYPQKKSAGFYLSATAFVLLIITLLITLLVEVPIDNEIKGWTAATLPSNWESIRNRWDTFHTIRTFTSLASFAGFLLPLLFTNPGKKQL